MQPQYNDMIEVWNSDNSIHGRGYTEEILENEITFRLDKILYKALVMSLIYDGTGEYPVFVVPIECIREIGRWV